MSKIEAFKDDVERFLERTAMTPTAFGKAALGDPNFVFDLRNGRSPRLTNVEKVEEFMRETAAQSNGENTVNERTAA